MGSWFISVQERLITLLTTEILCAVNVECIFKYLGDTIGGCSDAVSTRIISSWKAFRDLLPILTYRGTRTKRRGNVFMCVKVLLYGSEVWPVVNKDVQQLVTADGGMIRWICGVSLKDPIPTTIISLPLRS